MISLAEILRTAAAALNNANVDFLLIGGFAVNHYGYARATMDVDMMIIAEAQDNVRSLLTSVGFESADRHYNVDFYRMSGGSPRLDMLKVDSETMRKLQARACHAEVMGQAVKVPALEDLLAMKFFALKHGNRKRFFKDLPDIVELSRANNLDPETVIKPLALRFADSAIYDLIARELRPEACPPNPEPRNPKPET